MPREQPSAYNKMRVQGTIEVLKSYVERDINYVPIADVEYIITMLAEMIQDKEKMICKVSK